MAKETKRMSMTVTVRSGQTHVPIAKRIAMIPRTRKIHQFRATGASIIALSLRRV
jgi:hypothetical protein